MSDFKPTAEQEAILHAGRSTQDNLLINALAGAAKTTTLVMLGRVLPLKPTLSVAFNKKIADEMAMRMPGHIESKTLNSVGHNVWGRRLGRRLIVEKDKLYTLVKEQGDAHTASDKSFILDNFAAFLRAGRKAKAYGYVPQGLYSGMAKSLLTPDEFLDEIATDLDFEPDDFFLAVMDAMLNKSIAQAYEAQVDFDDQLYMPTLFGGEWPKYPIVMVDEAQDLSALNHLMLEKLYGGRLIAVGDPFQSIYGFRGAHGNSMEYLGDKFSMQPLGLSTSFRCPRSVVEKARRYVPHMRFPEWAVEGKVQQLEEWSADTIPDGAAIICRTNAPLYSMALKLIKRGRGCKIYGNELGPAIIKQMKKLGDGAMDQNQMEAAIAEWEEKQLRGARESRKAVIHDRADCYRVFCSQAATLDEAVAFAEHVFKAGGMINLMTGHKAKGLEFDTVFHLDPWRIPSKFAQRSAEAGDDRQLQQERNLDYVITTRAKKELFLVNLEDFS